MLNVTVLLVDTYTYIEKIHGQGAYIHPNGKRYEGEWRDGYKWNIEYKNKDGQILRRWLKGELQQ